MSEKFPHLSDTKFPNLSNVNVWKYQNNFDYEKFNDIQMHIKVCSVPWDLGEVHIGMRSIPMGNVVGWESEEQRDNYLDSIDGVEWDTNYRSYHDNDTIRLDIPYEYMTYFNYVIIDYSEPIVSRPDIKPIKRWLYFIRDLKQISLSTTQCEIKRDSWSMFINDVSISHMVMERGHYAMAKSADVDTYLSYPRAYTDYLLTPDVSYGSPSVSTQIGMFNAQAEECYYVIATTGSVTSDLWGDYQTDGWRIVAQPNGNIEQNHPSYSIFAIDYSNFSTFWENMSSTMPQFISTIKCVYLMSKTLVEPQSEFTFCKVKCYRLMAKNGYTNIGTFNKESFGYGKFEDVTKLYTSPYCYLELSDGEGNDIRVNIEDCNSNTVELCNYISIAYPYMAIKSYLTSVGESVNRDISYFGLSARNFSTRGQWWRYFWDHKIPTFAIIEGSKTNSEYNGWYSRLSNKTQTEASADTANTISRQNARLTKSMTTNSAAGAVSNTGTQNLANSNITSNANTKIDEIAKLTNDLETASIENSNTLINALANADADAKIQSASISASAGLQTAINSANAGVATSAIGAVAGIAGGAVSGGGIGAIGGAIGGVASVASSAVNAQTNVTNAQINSGAQVGSAYVGANLTTTQAEKNVSANQTRNTNQNKFNSSNAGYQKSYNSKVTSEQNAAASAISSLNSSVARNNAQRQYISVVGGSAESLGSDFADAITVDSGSAKLSKDLSYANVATANKYSTREMWMQAPIEHGSFDNGEYQAVKPIGIWCELVTQPSDCIAQAGVEMKRYGYMYDGVVDFETFNVMSKFSYWKCKDIWMVAKNLPDAFVDEIRNYLLEGVTIWVSPEFIGNTSVFENERI